MNFKKSLCLSASVMGVMTLLSINTSKVQAADQSNQNTTTEQTSSNVEAPKVQAQNVEVQNNSQSHVEQNNVKSIRAVVTINYKGRGKVAVWSNYDATKHVTGKYLADGTRWKAFKVATDQVKRQWYNLGGNQWVDGQYIRLASTPPKIIIPLEKPMA